MYRSISERCGSSGGWYMSSEKVIRIASKRFQCFAVGGCYLASQELATICFRRDIFSIWWYDAQSLDSV